MSIKRIRLSPLDSREAALDAARELLIQSGPQAVTLKAVAARIGRTHANLLHHFGSAADLQKALATSLAEVITEKIAVAVACTRAGEGEPREVVDLVFDAFDKEGAGALASWMIVNGNADALDPIVDAIHRLVDELREGTQSDVDLHSITLWLVLAALGDALLGRTLANALGLPRDAARETALAHLRRSAGMDDDIEKSP